MKKLLCRIFGHVPFDCYLCRLALIGITVAGIRVPTACPNEDDHNTCARCEKELPR